MALGYIIAVMVAAALVLVLIIGMMIKSHLKPKDLIDEKEYTEKNYGQDVIERYEFIKDNICFDAWSDDDKEVFDKYSKSRQEVRSKNKHIRETNDENMVLLEKWQFRIFLICIILVTIFVCAIIMTPIILASAHQKILEYKEMQYIWETAIKNGKPLENMQITQRMISYNSFLAKAKADKETWGCASRYFYEDLDSMKPLVIERGE